ncbi:MAG: hypothetical protein KDI16_06155, partial [Halioglobus sp.]|nr:hypothetical protein [Halioglobus sp.]
GILGGRRGFFVYSVSRGIQCVRPHTVIISGTKGGISGAFNIDGGLVANAPDLVALTQTLSRTTHALQDCWMASVGTVSPDIAKAAAEASFGMGALGWMTTQKLFNLTLAAQE